MCLRFIINQIFMMANLLINMTQPEECKQWNNEEWDHVDILQNNHSNCSQLNTGSFYNPFPKIMFFSKITPITPVTFHKIFNFLINSLSLWIIWRSIPRWTCNTLLQKQINLLHYKTTVCVFSKTTDYICI